MSQFKFEGNQKVWIATTGQIVTVIARTEFFTGKQPRYCVQADEGSIQGKNVSEDWINESALTDVEPVAPETQEQAATPDPRLAGEKKKKGIRTHGLG